MPRPTETALNMFAVWRKADRIMDEQMNKFLISVGDNDSEDERELDLDDSSTDNNDANDAI